MDRSHKSWLTMSLFWIAVTAGCSGRPDMAEVRGRVMFKDGTVPHGALSVIRFEPAADSTAQIRKAASADIQSDGFFEAFTRKPGDGVFLGKYNVVFSVIGDPNDSSTSLIDRKYTRAETTPYQVTIEDDVSDLEFELEPATAGKATK